MAKNGAVLEVSSVDVEEEGGEIEFSLGLSIGGSFCKSAKFKPEEENTMISREKIVSESVNAGVDLTRENQCFARTSMAQTTVVGDSEPESGSECLDPQRQREIHALRRHEARKKREEKLRKGISRGVNPTNAGFTVASASSDDKMWLEKQRLQNRVADREMRENEANAAERACKREKNEVVGNKCVLNEEGNDLNLSLNHNGAQIMTHGPSGVAYGSSSSSSSPVPVVPVQFPYPPPVQFVPFPSGCAYPCVMPCWNPPAAGNAGCERNFQQPAGCQSFRPYQGNVNSGQNSLMGSDSEHNSGKDGENRNAVSNGSPVCSSSVVSNHRSTSRQGGSTHSGSHSSHCKPEQSQLNMASELFGQSEQSVSCNQIESSQANTKAGNSSEKAVSSGIIHSPTKHIERINSETQPDLARKPMSSQNPNPSPSKVVSRDLSKPPKPETRSQNAPSFSQMPCVSTTGNGPNGKTITGFLYRYTKTEVSIICVCHGSSFSPAEFVEHAGGKDITHPLRHITVIPPAF